MISLILFLLALVIGIIIVVLGAWITFKWEDNECLPDALRTGIELVNRSKHSVNMVTDLSPECFENKLFLSIVQDAVGNGVHFNILYESEKGLEKLHKFKRLVQESDNKIVARQLTIKPPYHFWVADSNHVRIEKPHPKGDVKKVEAYLRFNTLTLGVRYQKIFSALWRKK